MVIRYLGLFILLAKAYAQDSALLGDLFDGIDSKGNATNCAGVKGQLKGCYNCYMCDEPQVKRHREQGSTIETLELIDENCAKVEVCCTAQTSLSSFRSKGQCGMEIPEGYPRAVRETSRSALQGEYPWRAWIYSNYDQSKPLCAATFIGDTINGLIAPASCLEGQNENTIFVVFNQNLHKAIKLDVKKILVHEDFDGSHFNDLAILSLPTLPDRLKWVHPACLPREPVQFGTVCSAISDDNYFVQVSIPQRKYCESYNNTILEEEVRNPTLMCSMSIEKDYLPQYGSGLFCMEEQSTSPIHVIYGMAVYTKLNIITFYTNIAVFSGWIEKQIQKLFIETHPSLYIKPSASYYGRYI